VPPDFQEDFAEGARGGDHPQPHPGADNIDGHGDNAHEDEFMGNQGTFETLFHLQMEHSDFSLELDYDNFHLHQRLRFVTITSIPTHLSILIWMSLQIWPSYQSSSRAC